MLFCFRISSNTRKRVRENTKQKMGETRARMLEGVLFIFSRNPSSVFVFPQLNMYVCVHIYVYIYKHVDINIWRWSRLSLRISWNILAPLYILTRPSCTETQMGCVSSSCPNPPLQHRIPCSWLRTLLFWFLCPPFFWSYSIGLTRAIVAGTAL